MISCAAWIRHLEEHLPIAHEGRDPEGVHQVRVAAGRLATWLELGGQRALRDDLRWLRGRAAAVRDLDVLLATHPPAEWARWLERQRRGTRDDLMAALASPRLAALLAALRLQPPLAVASARAGREGIRDRVLRRGARLVERPQDVERLHDLRRALRRLRYADDALGLDASAWKLLQDAFGLLNDLAVAQRLLSEYPGRAGLGAHAADLAARFEEARRTALAAWGATRPALERPPHVLRPSPRPSRRGRSREAAPARRRASAHARGRGGVRRDR